MSKKTAKVEKPSYKELNTLLDDCVATHNTLYDSWQLERGALLRNVMRAVELGNEFADERDAARRELTGFSRALEEKNETIAAQQRLLVEASKVRHNTDENILRMFHSEVR